MQPFKPIILCLSEIGHMVGASICGQEHITELVDECIGISTSNLTQNGGGGGCSDMSSDKFIDEVVHVFVKVSSTQKLYASLYPGCLPQLISVTFTLLLHLYKRKETYGEHYNENLSFCLSVKLCFLPFNNNNNNMVWQCVKMVPSRIVNCFYEAGSDSRMGRIT